MLRPALGLALVLLLSACGSEPAQPRGSVPPPPLETLTLVRESAPRERVWDGVVEAVHQATLSAQTGGRVLELPFDVNDYVAAGQVVVRFTDVEQQAGRRRAEAAQASAQAGFNEAEAEYARIAEVYERRLVSKSQLDQATARRDSARAQLEVARVALREAGEAVDYTVVRAPYAGILTQRHVEVGETVRPGQPLVSGLSLNRLRVNVDVPQSEVAAIREHGRAAVLLDDGRRIEAEKLTIFPFADPATHSFKLRLDLPEAETGLQPGMIAKAAFVLGQAERLFVPASALLTRSEVTAVYVVAADNRVSLRQVRPGHRYADRIEILAGLAEGERVVLDPVAARGWLASQRSAS
jgi:RND family efflux transporter MFP subunit